MNLVLALSLLTLFLLLVLTTITKVFFQRRFPREIKKGIYSELNHKSIVELSRYNSDYFSFAVIGDPHNSVLVLNKMIDLINKDDEIKFVVILGDITLKGSLEEYILNLERIKKFKKPVLVAIGNHDIHKNGRDWFYKIFGDFYYSFSFDNTHFIILDTSEKRFVPQSELRFVEEELKKSKNFKFKFVFSHIPLFDPTKGENNTGHSLHNIEISLRLIKLFKEHGINMVFCGHIHGFFKGYWDSIPYIITGGGGGELAGVGKNYFYHYLKVSVGPDELKYEPVKVELEKLELKLDYLLKKKIIPFFVYLSKNYTPISITLISAIIIILILTLKY